MLRGFLILTFAGLAVSAARGDGGKSHVIAVPVDGVVRSLRTRVTAEGSVEPEQALSVQERRGIWRQVKVELPALREDVASLPSLSYLDYGRGDDRRRSDREEAELLARQRSRLREVDSRANRISQYLDLLEAGGTSGKDGAASNEPASAPGDVEKDDIATARAELASLRGQIERHQRELRDAQARQQEIARREREAERERQLRQSVYGPIAALNAAMNAGGARGGSGAGGSSSPSAPAVPFPVTAIPFRFSPPPKEDLATKSFLAAIASASARLLSNGAGARDLQAPAPTVSPVPLVYGPDVYARALGILDVSARVPPVR